MTGSATPVHTNVLVLVPASVQVPPPHTSGDPNHIVFLGNVTGTNVAVGPDTSPPDPTVAKDHRELITRYGTTMTISVLDQFGKILGSIFAGMPVTEGGIPIKQTMTAGGTYSDPVAEIFPKDPVIVLITDTTEINNWTNSSVPAIKTDHESVNRAVEVGDQGLSPAVVNRGYYAGSNVDEPNNFMIAWPDPSP